MARTLLYDLENSPNLAFVWDLWEANALSVEVPWEILSVAWKWLGDRKVQSMTREDCDNPDTDYDIVKRIWELFDEADVVVAHNGNSFDQPKSRARMLVHGMPPPSPFKEVDTLLIARRHFKFGSNKLGDLGKTLGVGGKVQHTGFSLWQACMKGDPAAWKLMRRYNQQDVVLLEKVYLKLRPWMPRHPNIPAIDGKPDACPVCSSTELTLKGKTHTARTWRQRYVCRECGHFCSGAKIEKTGATTV